MKIRASVLYILVCTCTLSGCAEFITPRYTMSADAHVALKALAPQSVSLGAFTLSTSFNAVCRGNPLGVSDGITHVEYIKKAFEDEMKFAGLHAESGARTVLTGNVTKLVGSSVRRLTDGYWEIDLTISSSNGKRVSASETYEFHAGFSGVVACKQTADAFLAAVQNVVAKIVRSPDFKSLFQQ